MSRVLVMVHKVEVKVACRHLILLLIVLDATGVQLAND